MIYRVRCDMARGIEGVTHMKADPDDILSHESRRSSFPFIELLLALALIAGLAFFWFWSQEKEPVETALEYPAVIAPSSPPELPTTPDIPERDAVVAADATADTAANAADGSADSIVVEAPAPLTLEEGNMLLRRQLAAAGGDANLAKLADAEHPIDLSAALIDGMGRGIILRKMLPLEAPKPAFSVEQKGTTLYMSTASYARYNTFTDVITGLNSGVLVETFHALRPLLKNAYAELGLDPEDLDNAIIRTLDLVLATPEINEPIAVKTKSVVYVFEDPALEALPAVQKQLLRAGPDNLRRIKQQARMLREGLLAQ
jgi:hypothetical protein